MRTWTRVGLILAVLAVGAVGAGAAGATTRRIPMTSFVKSFERTPTGATMLTPGGVFALGPAVVPPTVGWIGFYRLRLPVGTLVKNVRYYHRGLGSGGSLVSFSRSRFPAASTLLASGDSSDVSGNLVPVPLVWEAGAQRRIRRGFTYTIGVTLEPSAGVHGVEVEY